jgi:hypothetical protein
MLLTLIGLNILSSGVIVIAGVIPSDFIVERLRIGYRDDTSPTSFWRVFQEDEFLSINYLKHKVISIPVNNEFIKPLYPDVNTLERAPQISITTENGATKIISDLRGLPSFILKQNLIKESDLPVPSARQTGPALKIEHTETQNIHKYHLVNKTNNPMEDCFILTTSAKGGSASGGKGAAYLGRISVGETKEVKLTGSDFVDWKQFLSRYLVGYDRTTIYQKRLLEMWYNNYLSTSAKGGSASGGNELVVGWTNAPTPSGGAAEESGLFRGNHQNIVDYPELWIIPLAETH